MYSVYKAAGLQTCVALVLLVVHPALTLQKSQALRAALP